MNFDQAEFEVRCEWGEKGVLQLAPISDVVIIIDVLSFSTCIDIANSRGAIVFPYQWQDEEVLVNLLNRESSSVVLVKNLLSEALNKMLI